MQQKLGASVLTETEHILQFIAHAIEPRRSEDKLGRIARGLEALRVVEDSDDETQEPHTQDEIIVTAVTLLLSILEGTPRNRTCDSRLIPRTCSR